MRKLEYRAKLAHKTFAIPSWISREIFPNINSKSKTKQFSAEKNIYKTFKKLKVNYCVYFFICCALSLIYPQQKRGGKALYNMRPQTDLPFRQAFVDVSKFSLEILNCLGRTYEGHCTPWRCSSRSLALRNHRRAGKTNEHVRRPYHSHAIDSTDLLLWHFISSRILSNFSLINGL